MQGLTDLRGLGCHASSRTRSPVLYGNVGYVMYPYCRLVSRCCSAWMPTRTWSWEWHSFAGVSTRPSRYTKSSILHCIHGYYQEKMMMWRGEAPMTLHKTPGFAVSNSRQSSLTLPSTWWLYSFSTKWFWIFASRYVRDLPVVGCLRRHVAYNGPDINCWKRSNSLWSFKEFAPLRWPVCFCSQLITLWLRKMQKLGLGTAQCKKIGLIDYEKQDEVTERTRFRKEDNAFMPDVGAKGNYSRIGVHQSSEALLV